MTRRKFYPAPEHDAQIEALEAEATLKEKIARIRMDATLAHHQGFHQEAEKLFTYADTLAQRPLLKPPKKKKPTQLKLDLP